MNIIYFKSDIGNFGDDLNPWLWHELLGEKSSYDKSLDFVGIGSILDSRIESNNRKVVFGSGVRDFNFEISDISNVDIRFVRGPISSKVTHSKYITDAAYALRLLPKKTYTKKYKISIVPYFRHYKQFNWQLLEKITGIHVIDPTQHVEKVIEEINESQKILAAAMHGAILADIYRVPWMRVKFSKHGYESALTSELKWNDWFGSIELNEVPTHYFDFNFNQKLSKPKQWYALLKMKFKFKKNRFIMSSNEVIQDIDSKIKLEIEQFKTKYKNV